MCLFKLRLYSQTWIQAPSGNQKSDSLQYDAVCNPTPGQADVAHVLSRDAAFQLLNARRTELLHQKLLAF